MIGRVRAEARQSTNLYVGNNIFWRISSRILLMTKTVLLKSTVTDIAKVHLFIIMFSCWLILL